MKTSIRFLPRYMGPSVYLDPKERQSSVRRRGRRGRSAFANKPLNIQFAIRTNAKAHTFACHSPEFNQKLHKNMIAFWDRKMYRHNVSVQYINTYTLHRVM